MFAVDDVWVDTDVPTVTTAPSPTAAPEPASSPQTSTIHHRIDSLARGYRFHSPNDAGFRTTAFVAPFEKGVVDGVVDSRMGRGDLWGSSTCHCMQCEAVRVLSKVADVSRTMVAPSPSSPRHHHPSVVVVAVDLDNFGFNHFKQPYQKVIGAGGDVVATTTARSGALGKKRVRDDSSVKNARRPPLDDEEDIVSRCVFWGFHGACFSRQHRTTPQEFLNAALQTSLSNKESHTATTSPSSSNQRERDGSGRSVWEELLLRDRQQPPPDSRHKGGSARSYPTSLSPHLHITPCGGHSQAVDEVMLAATWHLSGASAAEGGSPVTAAVQIPMVVVTGDKGLAEAISGACGNAATTAPSLVRVLFSNAPKLEGGRLTLVWREVTKLVSTL